VLDAKVPVHFGDKQPAVFVAEPAGNYPEVYVLLNRVARKKVSHGVMVERRQPGKLAR